MKYHNITPKRQSLKQFEIDLGICHHELRLPWDKSELQINRIIINAPATIVFWNDGTKTVVKISEDDLHDGKYDIYAGVSYAIAKKLFGSNSAFKREVDRKTEDKTPVHVSKYFSQEQLKEMAEISTKLLKHFIGEKKS